MAPELQNLLACPQCQGPIELRPRTDGADATAEWVCRSCRLAFAVKDDIANFLLEEARPLRD